jgi:hypothetical protein
MRLDFAHQSVITNPAAGEAIVLDHVKKEAMTIPLDKAPAPVPKLGPGGLPSPSLPLAAPPHAQDLGKSVIDGHEVEGKLFTLHPPQPPVTQAAVPQAAIPQAKLPGLTPPAPPKAPQTVEMWTSTQHRLPVLTTVTGSFGKQVSRCKCATAQHPPSSFAIPSGYKVRPASP